MAFCSAFLHLPQKLTKLVNFGKEWADVCAAAGRVGVGMLLVLHSRVSGTGGDGRLLAFSPVGVEWVSATPPWTPVLDTAIHFSSSNRRSN
jgi:hypothetical protein